MAKNEILAEDLAFGRAVLLATDALKMSAEGAFWIKYGGEDRWRYFIVTSLFDSMGPREIYLRLNKALAKKLSEKETKSFDIFMAGPHEAFLRKFPRSVRTAHYASEPFHVSVGVDEKKADVWVYRFARGMDERFTKRTERRFKREVSELLAA